jgi:ATP-dependent helicase/nuclease subunit B
LLRIKALTADELEQDQQSLALAAQLDEPAHKVPFESRPLPRPSAQQRLVSLSVTDFDQLKSDPYSFYAKRILGLRVLEKVDTEPSFAWRGSLVHDLLEQWFKQDNCAVDKLVQRIRCYVPCGNHALPLACAGWPKKPKSRCMTTGGLLRWPNKPARSTSWASP